MTDSPIKVIDQFLPPEVFLPLAYHIMTYDSYRCFDFTTYAHEGDGSIESVSYTHLTLPTTPYV